MNELLLIQLLFFLDKFFLVIIHIQASKRGETFYTQFHSVYSHIIPLIPEP